MADPAQPQGNFITQFWNKITNGDNDQATLRAWSLMLAVALLGIAGGFLLFGPGTKPFLGGFNVVMSCIMADIIMYFLWKLPTNLEGVSSYMKWFIDTSVVTGCLILASCIQDASTVIAAYFFLFHLLPFSNVVGIAENLGVYDCYMAIILEGTYHLLRENHVTVGLEYVYIFLLAGFCQMWKHLNENYVRALFQAHAAQN